MACQQDIYFIAATYAAFIYFRANTMIQEIFSTYNWSYV